MTYAHQISCLTLFALCAVVLAGIAARDLALSRREKRLFAATPHRVVKDPWPLMALSLASGAVLAMAMGFLLHDGNEWSACLAMVMSVLSFSNAVCALVWKIYIFEDGDGFLFVSRVGQRAFVEYGRISDYRSAVETRSDGFVRTAGGRCFRIGKGASNAQALYEKLREHGVYEKLAAPKRYRVQNK